MINSPYQKYQQASVQTASPGQLIIMLYDGAIRFIRQSIEGIENRKYEQANNNLIKAQAIIHELVASLNFDYPISKDLVRIYEYMLHQLIQSNVKKDTKPALEVMKHLEDLKESWQQVIKPSSAAASN